MKTLINILAWVGTATSIIGAFVVASQYMLAGYSFFLMGSFSWLITGIYRRDNALIILNFTFFLANILGFYNAL